MARNINNGKEHEPGFSLDEQRVFLLKHSLFGNNSLNESELTSYSQPFLQYLRDERLYSPAQINDTLYEGLSATEKTAVQSNLTSVVGEDLFTYVQSQIRSPREAGYGARMTELDLIMTSIQKAMIDNDPAHFLSTDTLYDVYLKHLFYHEMSRSKEAYHGISVALHDYMSKERSDMLHDALLQHRIQKDIKNADKTFGTHHIKEEVLKGLAKEQNQSLHVIIQGIKSVKSYIAKCTNLSDEQVRVIGSMPADIQEKLLRGSRVFDDFKVSHPIASAKLESLMAIEPALVTFDQIQALDPTDDELELFKELFRNMSLLTNETADLMNDIKARPSATAKSQLAVVFPKVEFTPGLLKKIYDEYELLPAGVSPAPMMSIVPADAGKLHAMELLGLDHERISDGEKMRSILPFFEQIQAGYQLLEQLSAVSATTITFEHVEQFVSLAGDDLGRRKFERDVLQLDQTDTSNRKHQQDTLTEMYNAYEKVPLPPGVVATKMLVRKVLAGYQGVNYADPAVRMLPQYVTNSHTSPRRAIYDEMQLEYNNPSHHSDLEALIPTLRELYAQQLVVEEVVTKHTSSIEESKTLESSFDNMFRSKDATLPQKKRMFIYGVLQNKQAEYTRGMSKITTSLQDKKNQHKRSDLEKEYKELENKWQSITGLMARYARDPHITLAETYEISSSFEGSEEKDVRDSIHNTLGNILERGASTIIDENNSTPNHKNALLDGILNMDITLEKRDVLDKFMKASLKKMYKMKGIQVPEHLDTFTIEDSGWFYVKQTGTPSFNEYISVAQFKNLGGVEALKTFCYEVLESVGNAGAKTQIEFVYNAEHDPITASNLEDQINKRLLESTEVSSPNKTREVREGSIWAEGTEKLKLLQITPEGVVYRLLDDNDDERGKNIIMPLEQFYLMATSPDSRKDAYLNYERHEEVMEEDLMESTKGRGADIGWLTLRGFLGAGKSILEGFKNNRERRQKIRAALVQVSLGGSISRLSGLTSSAEKEIAGYEEEIAKEEIWEKFDKLDDSDRERKIESFMADVTPTKPNIHLLDRPGWYPIMGKLYTHVTARAMVKGMMLYVLKRYGTLYPFESMRTKTPNYWYKIMVPRSVGPKAEQLALASDPDDGYTEYKQIVAASKAQPGVLGYTYANSIESAFTEGQGKAKETMEEKLKACVTTGQLVDLINTYIRDKRWPALELAIAKLHAKGKSSEDLFNIFLYIFDQSRFRRNGEYSSEIPFEILQNFGKAIFPGYPDAYYFMFRNKFFFNQFANSLDKLPNIERTSDGRLAWDESNKGKLPKPVSNSNIYSHFTMDGKGVNGHPDFSLLNGYANETTKDPFLVSIGNYLTNAGYKLDPAGHDPEMWTRCTLLTLSPPMLGMVSTYYKVGDFEYPHIQKYFETLLDQVGELNLNTGKTVGEKDRDAFLKYVRTLFYKHVYLPMSADSEMVGEVVYGNKRKQRGYQTIEKEDYRRGTRFLEQYYDRFKGLGLDFDTCAEAAGAKERVNKKQHITPITEKMEERQRTGAIRDDMD